MSLTAYGLQCEHRAEPLGVDEPHPSFGWKLAASSPGRSQQAYRLTVRPAGAPEPSWDSGWVEDAGHHQVVYAGPPLQPSTRYTWDVQLTDDRGQRGEPAASWFETGLLTPGAWTARWIRRDPRTRPPVDPPQEGDSRYADRLARAPGPVPPGVRAAQPAGPGPGLRDGARDLPAPGQRRAGRPRRADARLDRLSPPAAVPGLRHHRPAADRAQRGRRDRR